MRVVTQQELARAANRASLFDTLPAAVSVCVCVCGCASVSV